MIKQKIVAATLALSVVASGVLADSTLGEQSTRLESMQLNNYMTKDGFNIFFNPANIANAKTGAFLELGALNPNGGATTVDQGSNTPVNGYAGLFFDGGSIGNFGLVLNRDNQNPVLGGNAQNNIDLFYGLALSSDLNLGLRLTYASAADNTSDSVDDLRVFNDANTTTGVYNQDFSDLQSWSTDDSGTDLTIEVGVQTLGLDATLTYGMYEMSGSETGATNNHFKTTLYNDTIANNGIGINFDDNVSRITTSNENDTYEADGASLLELALAYTLELDAKSTLTAYGVYSAADYSSKGTSKLNQQQDDYNASTTGQITQTDTNDVESSWAESVTEDMIKLGAAYNLKPNDDLLLVVAAEYTSTKETTKYSNTDTKNVATTTLFATTPNTVTTVNGTTGTTNSTPDDIVTESDISVVVAAEAKATENLTLRFGLRESVYNTFETNNPSSTNNVVYSNDDADTDGTDNTLSNDTTTTVEDSTTTNDADDNLQPNMQVAIGFGYQATKDISIDGLLDANLLLGGPNFVTGAVNTLNARVAVNYNF